MVIRFYTYEFHHSFNPALSSSICCNWRLSSPHSGCPYRAPNAAKNEAFQGERFRFSLILTMTPPSNISTHSLHNPCLGPCCERTPSCSSLVALCDRNTLGIGAGSSEVLPIHAGEFDLVRTATCRARSGWSLDLVVRAVPVLV